MIYYSAMVGVAVVFALLEMGRPERTIFNRILLRISCVIAIILVGFREEVGADWYVYLCYHALAEFEPFHYFITINDPAYMAISWLTARAGLGVWAVNLPCACLLVWGIYRLSSHVQYRNLFFLSGLPILIIVVGMGFSRQSAAIGIFCLALHFLLSEKRISAAVFAVLALSFHESAAFGVTLIFLTYGRKIWHRIVIATVALPLIAFFVMLEGYHIAQRGYIEAEYQAAGALIRILQVFFCGLGYFALLQRSALKSERPTLTAIAAVSVLSLPVLLLSPSSTLIDRLALYLLPFQCYVLANIPTAFLRGTSRKLVIVLVILLNVSIFLVWMALAVNSESWINYKNFLWSGSSMSFQSIPFCK